LKSPRRIYNFVSGSPMFMFLWFSKNKDLLILLREVFTPSARFLREQLTKKHENWKTAKKFTAFLGEPLTKKHKH
jgi:hypothetical protein